MQPLVAPPRDGLTEDDVRAILTADSVEWSAGLELISAAGVRIQDLSDRLEDGGKVHRNNYGTVHGSCSLRLNQAIDWGAARLRPFLTATAAAGAARFNAGAYLLDLPEQVIGATPPSFDVVGLDPLCILDVPAGQMYEAAAGANCIDEAEAILDAHGAGTPHRIESSSKTLPSTRLWPLDDTTTWLHIVNEFLNTAGHRGLYADWDGAYRSEAYRSPSDRGPEWIYDADVVDTIVGPDRRAKGSYLKAPNRWVIVRDNPAAGLPTPSNGFTYTVLNPSDGPTSIAGRGGRTISKVVFVDAADAAALQSRGDEIVDTDLRLDTTLRLQVGANPLHWHADVIGYRDAAMGPPVNAAVHEWDLLLDGGDMELTARKI